MVYSSFAGVVSLISRIAASYAMVSLFANMAIAYSEAFSWVILLLLYLARLLWKERNTKKSAVCV